MPHTETEELPVDQFSQMAMDLVMTQARTLAMLPLEKWLESLEHSESVAVFLDPTLYRDYIYSGRAEVIKPILSAAIRLKQEFLKAQKAVAEGKVR